MVISLTTTNLFENSNSKIFSSYFSESSFAKTLQKLTKCGEYNKTKKRKRPMYCFGSTITCTQYPKFSVCGKQHILPSPYSKSKPGNDGYKIIWTVWIQKFLKEVETHVLHYLHNFCEDNTLKKMTLFNIELVRKLIPECLRLGNSFFTHMTVFGTVNKEDGSMPIHFDERDLISCVFHLGSVQKGGETSYYNGDKSDNPGQPVHQVSFKHGNL